MAQYYTSLCREEAERWEQTMRTTLYHTVVYVVILAKCQIVLQSWLDKSISAAACSSIRFGYMCTKLLSNLTNEESGYCNNFRHTFRHFKYEWQVFLEQLLFFPWINNKREKRCIDGTVKLRSEQIDCTDKGTKNAPNKPIFYKLSQKETSVWRENIMPGTEIVFQNQKQCKGTVSVPLNKQLYQTGSWNDSQMSMFLSTEWIKPDGFVSTWLLLFHS